MLETVTSRVAEACMKDHRGLDAAFDALDAAYAKDHPLETARAAAAFRFHLNMHLGKEDTHLYRIFEERVPSPDRERPWVSCGPRFPRTGSRRSCSGSSP